MDVTLSIPFVLQTTEALSDDLRSSVQEEIRKEVEATVSQTLSSESLDSNSLFTPDQTVVVYAVSWIPCGVDPTTECSSGAPLKISNSLFVASILWKLLN